MATVRENKLKRKANQIAGYAYDMFAKGQGTGSLGLSQGDFRKLGNKRDSVLKGLSQKYYERLLESYPEESWNDQESKGLEDAKIEDVASSLIDEKNPANLKKKIEFAAYKDLIAPEEEGAKDWYGMNQEQIGKAMLDRGYNPKNPTDVEKFFDKLTEHDVNYNRGKAVGDFTKSWGGMLSASIAPTAYKEAVRQAYEDGPIDKGRVRLAALIDALTIPAMFMGGTIPGSLLKSGGAMVGTEAARQAAAATALDQKFDVPAVVESGIAAATLPNLFNVGAAKLGGRMGTSQATKDFYRGLRSSAQGNAYKTADNLVEEEADRLKQQLLEARRLRGADAQSTVVTPKQTREQKLVDDMQDKLMTLGFDNRERTYHPADPNLQQKVGEYMSEANRNTANAVPMGQGFSLATMLDLPTARRTIDDEAASAVLESAYRNPMTYNMLNRSQDANKWAKATRPNGGVGTPEAATAEEVAAFDRAAQRSAERQVLLEKYFPTMMSVRSGEVPTAPSKAYTFGNWVGGTAGSDASIIENMFGGVRWLTDKALADDEDSNINITKTDSYKRQPWYKTMTKAAKRDPKVRETLTAIEAGLKGAR